LGANYSNELTHVLISFPLKTATGAERPLRQSVVIQKFKFTSPQIFIYLIPNILLMVT